MKLTPARNMKTVMTHSTAGLRNPPTDAVLVENPPVPSVEKVWQIASNGLIPARRRATNSAMLSAT